MGYEYVLKKGFIKDINRMIEQSLIENLERVGMIKGKIYPNKYEVEFKKIHDITDEVECRTGLDSFSPGSISYGKDLVDMIQYEIQNGLSIGTFHTHIIEYHNVLNISESDERFLKKSGGIMMSGGWSPYNKGGYGYLKIYQLDDSKVDIRLKQIELKLSKKALDAGKNLDNRVQAMHDPWD